MSTDLFKDNPSVFEHPKVKDDEQIVSALTEEFNQLFKREGLEQNLQIVSKMSSSLELPITSIYKDKAVLTISNNLALIREALSRSTSVEYDSDRGIIRPKFKALRNKIVVNKIPEQLKQNFLQLVTGSQEYTEKISEKYLDNIKSFNISVITEESASSLFEKIKSFFDSNKISIEVHLEYEDLYLNIFQRSQESYKRQVYSQESATADSPTRPNQFYQYAMPNPYGYRNTPYYGYNTYGNYGGYPGYSPGYYGPNANTFSGPGSNQLFIRKAQDENYEEQQEEYNGGGGRYGGGRRREKNGRRNQGERRVKNEEKKERKVISEADINDVEKFPPLLSKPSNDTATNDMFSPSKKKSEKIEQSQEEAKKVDEKKFIKIKPKAMIEEFKNQGEHVKPDTKLAGMDSTLIPVLNLGITPDLEAINPTPPKDVKETPKLNPMTPKQSFKAN